MIERAPDPQSDEGPRGADDAACGQALEGLLVSLVDGELDEDGRRRLAALLESSAVARRFYRRFLEVHTLLEWEHGALGSTPGAPPLVTARRHAGARPRTAWREVHVMLAAVAAVILVATPVTFLFFERPPRPPRPALERGAGSADRLARRHYEDNAMPPAPVAVLKDGDPRWSGPGQRLGRGAKVVPGTVRLLDGTARFAFDAGAEVTVAGPTVLGLEASDRATLFAGSLSARLSHPDASFTVDTQSVRLVDLGTSFTVRVAGNGETVVEVTDGEVEVRVPAHGPVAYYSFDHPPGELLHDHVSGQWATVGAGVRRVMGLVGAGALAFDDSRAAYVDLGDGGGRTVGTGRFAVARGVTIEALIVPRWSGRGASTGDAEYDYDYDEIFRKEDGEYRMLLSFQNDHWDYEVPPVEAGPCLSFGIYLSDLGYSELDMPLDGRDGRPTLAELADGRAHHVVATYNSWNGVKAVYIDGVRRFSHRFPPGTLVISGGSARATIGNMRPGGIEPFRGVIDEVAFYDTALGAAEIREHFANVQAGRPYFGDDGDAALRQGWRAVRRLRQGETARFPSAPGEGDTGRPR